MPVSRTCTFCGNDIEPGTGKMYVKRDGNVHFFCSGKCQKNQLDMGRVGRKVRWTRRYVRAAQQRAPRPQAGAQVVTKAAPDAEEAVPEEGAAGAEAAPEAGREEVLQTFAKLPGVGPTTAEALWEAGFHSMKELQEGSEEELAGVRGLGPASAKKILAHLKEAS
jgi:large subunit ribosomal protein L24e